MESQKQSPSLKERFFGKQKKLYTYPTDVRVLHKAMSLAAGLSTAVMQHNNVQADPALCVLDAVAVGSVTFFVGSVGCLAAEEQKKYVDAKRMKDIDARLVWCPCSLCRPCHPRPI